MSHILPLYSIANGEETQFINYLLYVLIIFTLHLLSRHENSKCTIICIYKDKQFVLERAIYKRKLIISSSVFYSQFHCMHFCAKYNFFHHYYIFRNYKNPKLHTLKIHFIIPKIHFIIPTRKYQYMYIYFIIIYIM